ncbi:PaaI family thioesterase [Pseudomonas syringae]|nr:PaaI family thioesterase [Pseudomonas syringae]MBD8577151.1 PaaI family thioesterase [Pseudomonas syringae]MBD8792775.1 PaaI family thioesterase [Pseudomonas syringae]MBD8803278.1 PaaI family thioesterase [Pseudomonas syringae]MBD8811875.1 PaaI family thioesterase [Pseudomonas syringae]
MHALIDNPDRALLERLLGEEASDVALEMTEHLRQLDVRLVKGSPGHLELSFRASGADLQGNNVVAGGTLMTMLDYAMAFAVLSQLPAGRTCATTSITVNMQSAAGPARLKVIGQVDRVGRQVAFARAELLDPESNKRVANACATFAVLECR